ncbi:MAG: Hsp20/alpha crystallin family protein [Deltaproteobacteria bacterium]|nr:Hsp20/alpha crystallin family protein [Deltaproteobacteria bacterium]MBW2362898.1 Hsp20/alpha crystallin family protein [Deltaproteobacteria bacterium]
MTSLIIPRRTRRSLTPALRGGFPVDRLFEDFWGGFDAAPSAPAGFTPRLDVKETDAEYVVTAELPGLEVKDVEILLEEDVLTVRGEKRAEHSDEKAGYKHVETIAGSFERRLALPTEVDADAVSATSKNGVITITLPKRLAAQPSTRAIPVTSA